MPAWTFALFSLAGAVPLLRAWLANRHTSLAHALLWALAAWVAWGAALALGDAERLGFDPARAIALSLTAAAGVAVLGARRPHVGAWNFVVLGLLGVMLLPLVESLVLGTPPGDPLRVFFLAATLVVVIGNYLPTRLLPAALVLGLACGGEMAGLFWSLPTPWLLTAHVGLLATPWVAWLSWPRRRAGADLERYWLDFRDRFGLLWALRCREQFNHAARHAGLPIALRWSRLTVSGPVVPDEAERLLDGVLRRFVGPADTSIKHESRTEV